MRQLIPFDPKSELFRWGPIPGRLLSISHWVEIFIDYRKRFHHHVWPPTFILIKHGQVLGVGDMHELENVGAQLFRDLVIGRRYKRGFREYRHRTASILRHTAAINAHALHDVSDTTLMREWKSFNKGIRTWWALGVIPELGGYGGQALLREQLRKTKLAEKDFHSAYAALAATEKPSFYQDEEAALAKTLRFRSNSAAELRALVRHARRYAWIGNSYFQTHREPVTTFKNRLRKMRRKHMTVSTQRSKLRAHAKAILKRKQQLLRRFPRPELRRMSIGVSRCVAWQDQRKAVIFKYLAAVDRLAREIERRAGIPTGTFNNAYYWEASLRPSSALLRLLRARRHGFASRFTGRPSADYTATAARSIIQRLWNPSGARVSTTLTGIPTFASKRPVQARAFVIRNHVDLSRFPNGAVLVSTMTAPEYVVAMRKAAAIVTDTGGITSHAAIVSRELKIPCIVGTKLATRILKTGDRVEVDANKGTVRKIYT